MGVDSVSSEITREWNQLKISNYRGFVSCFSHFSVRGGNLTQPYMSVAFFFSFGPGGPFVGAHCRVSVGYRVTLCEHFC
jgi:hypothetical protein